MDMVEQDTETHCSEPEVSIKDEPLLITNVVSEANAEDTSQIDELFNEKISSPWPHLEDYFNFEVKR